MELIELNLALENHYGMSMATYWRQGVPTLGKALLNQKKFKIYGAYINQ
jgi:hypothetical protein